MNDLRKYGHLCDVTFKIDSHRIRAHRIVVAAISPYFKCLFIDDMKERSQEEIEISNILPEIMVAIVDYAYTGEVKVTAENVEELLSAAGLLQIDRINDTCCNFLSDCMDMTNCLGIMQFANIHACPKLLKKVKHFIAMNFTEVIKHEEFLQLPHETLRELLNHDHLIVKSEHEVWRAFMIWVNHDLHVRANHSFQLLMAIRIPLLSKTFLMEVVAREALFQHNKDCKAVIENYLKGIEYDFWLHVKPRSRVETLYTVGGRDGDDCLASAERYNPEDDSWDEIAPMCHPRTAIATAALSGKLYVVGGQYKTRWLETIHLETVENYDPVTNSWNKTPNMDTSRSFIAVTVMAGEWRL